MGKRGPCPFTETDVVRFIRAVTAAGLPVFALTVDLMHHTFTAVTNKDAVKKIGGNEIITEEELKKLI